MGSFENASGKKRKAQHPALMEIASEIIVDAPAKAKAKPRDLSIDNAEEVKEAESKATGKFVITKASDDRFMFNLKAANSYIIATSGMYTTLSACKTGIASVATNAPESPVEDQTADDYETISNPKFALYRDTGGSFRFRLKARNGEIIAVSQGYTSKANCKNGIESVRVNASAPTVVETED